MTTALASYSASYLNRVPYITADMFNAAGTGVDTTKLVPKGDAQAQATALERRIRQASAWADELVFGASGILAATVNTEPQRIRANRLGEWFVVPFCKPILEVLSFSVGPTPNALTALDLSNTEVEWDHFTVVASTLSSMTPQGPLQFGGTRPGALVWSEYEYVNGWPVTTLASGAEAGAESITPASVVGMYPGTMMKLADSENLEIVQIASDYVTGATTVPLVSGLENTYGNGVILSALPDIIEQAVVALTSCLIKTRGSRASVMPSSPGQNPSRTALAQPGAFEDFDIARKILHPFKRVTP